MRIELTSAESESAIINSYTTRQYCWGGRSQTLDLWANTTNVLVTPHLNLIVVPSGFEPENPSRSSESKSEMLPVTPQDNLKFDVLLWIEQRYTGSKPVTLNRYVIGQCWAFKESWTPVSSLPRMYNSRYTMKAYVLYSKQIKVCCPNINRLHFILVIGDTKPAHLFNIIQ